MAHCRPGFEMEQTQRNLSQLNINENQGKTNQIINETRNHTTNPTNNEPHLDPEIQQHLIAIEKINQQNHANPNLRYRLYEQPHDAYTNKPLPNEPNEQIRNPTKHTPINSPTPPDTTKHIPIFTNPISRPTSRTSNASNYNNKDTITPIPRQRTETTKSFQNYRDTKNNSDISFSTTTSNLHEHNRTQIPRQPVIMQEPRLSYPKPTASLQNLYTPSTNHTDYQRYPNPTNEPNYIQQQHAQYDSRQLQSPIPQQEGQQQPELLITPAQPYSPHETPQQYPIRRVQAIHDLQIMNEINSIVSSDQFVKELSNDIINKNVSDSDSDSDNGLFCEPQTFTQQHNRYPQPTRRTHTPQQTNPHNTQLEPKITKTTNIEQQPKTNNTIKNNETQQQDTQYTVMYNEDNLYCYGKGWKTEFLNHSNETLFNSIKTNLQQSNATNISTNTPFKDLYTQLQSHTKQQNLSQHQQHENDNTISSNTSIQNLLTSTINESSPPHCIVPTISPINTIAQVHKHTDKQDNTNPHNIRQSLKQYEEIDSTLRTSYQQQPNNNNTTTQSLPMYDTSNYLPNDSITQLDGNDSDIDCTFQNPTPSTSTNQHTTKLTDQELEQQVLTKLNKLQTHDKFDIIRQTTKILQDARTHHDPTLPESNLQQIIRHKLTKCINAQIPKTNTKQKKTDILAHLQNLHPTQEHQNNNNSVLPKVEKSQQNQYDPERVAYIIQQNKDIIRQISTRTLDEEVDDEVNEITASLKHISHEMNNLTKNITDHKEDTTPTPLTRTPSPFPLSTYNTPMDHPYINNFEGIHPHEQQDKPLTSNVTTVHLNALSNNELNDMEAKVGSRCQDKFELTKAMYEQTILNIETIDLQTQHRVATEQITPQLLKQLKQTKQHLLKLRNQQLKLEKKLRKLSAIEENNNVGIIIPTFGNRKRNNRNWKSISAYNPKNDTNFDIIWRIIVARGIREQLDEDSYKEILEEVLKGDALRYYTKNQHKPLRSIIEILYNAYVTTKSRQQISSQLDNFRAHKDDTFRQTLEKLKLITCELFKDQDLTPERTARDEEIEIRRRIIENRLVDPPALAAVFRKQREYLFEGKHFNFIRELTQETDIQREAGNTTELQPQINTLDLFNTTATNATQPPSSKDDTQRIHIGKTDQNHLSARPRPPSQEKIDRMFRNSPSRFRPRSNTPHTSPNRHQSPSPNRAHTPQHMTSNTQRDTENRQRTSRQTEFDKRRFDNQQYDTTNIKNHQNPQNQQQPQRQRSNDTQYKYDQFTNNHFPQNPKGRSSSTAPQQQPRNPQYSTNRQNNHSGYNNPNYQPIRNQSSQNQRFNNNQSNNNKPHNLNQSQHQNNTQYRSPSPRQNNNRPQQNQPNNNPRWNQQDNNQQQQYKPKQNNFNNQAQFDNARILQHNMTYTGGNNREGKISQEFSFSQLCRKRICQNTPEHAYKLCPRPEDFPNRR